MTQASRTGPTVRSSFGSPPRAVLAIVGDDPVTRCASLGQRSGRLGAHATPTSRAPSLSGRSSPTGTNAPQ